MKNIFTSICLCLASISLVFAQGAEGFYQFHEKSIDFYSGTFVGANGINWNYMQCRNVSNNSKESLEKSGLVLKGDSTAEIISSVISGGIGLLKIDYSTYPSALAKFDVFVNRIKVATLNTAPSDNAITLSSGKLVVNMDKPFYIRIKQSDETSGQVFIRKVAWSKFSSEEYGTIEDDSFPVMANVAKSNPGLFKEHLAYQLFPNPAKDYVSIEMSEYHNVLFKLFTLTGQIVLQEQVKGSGQKINLNNLKEGLYIYKILDDKGKLVTGKMIIR